MLSREQISYGLFGCALSIPISYFGGSHSAAFFGSMTGGTLGLHIGTYQKLFVHRSVIDPQIVDFLDLTARQVAVLFACQIGSALIYKLPAISTHLESFCAPIDNSKECTIARNVNMLFLTTLWAFQGVTFWKTLTFAKKLSRAINLLPAINRS